MAHIYCMRTFGQYIESMFNEADEPPAGGPPPGGGGMPPPGGPPGLPRPPGGGGMPPMGGAPPMGGGGAAGAPTGAQPAQKVKTHNVWTELEKFLHNK